MLRNIRLHRGAVPGRAAARHVAPAADRHLTGDAFEPKTALEAFNRFQNEERTIEYVMLGTAQAGDIAARRPRCSTNISRSARSRSARRNFARSRSWCCAPADLAAQIEISDADLKKAYEARKARFETPERRKLKQIVFPNMEEAKAASEKLAERHELRGARHRTRAEGNRHRSRHRRQDRDCRPRGGRRRVRPEGGRNQRAGRGPLWHRHRQGRRDRAGAGRGRSRRSGRAQARARDRRARASEISTCRRRSRTSGSAARRSPRRRRSSPDPARDRSSTAPARMLDGKAVTGLREGVDVLSAAFSADVHGENEPLRLPGNGGFVWYDVDSITPARDRTLDEVKDQVLARWRDDQIATRLRAKSTEMLDKIKAGTSFNDAAAADQLKIEWRPGIKRGSPPPGLSAAAVDGDFRTAEGRHRQRRRRVARRAHRVPRHRDQGAGARSRSRPRPSASTRRCASAPPRT